MKLKPNQRLITALIACTIVSAAMIVVKRGYSFVVIPPDVRLSDAPTNVADWNAEEAELTDAEFGVLNAADLSSLRFTNSVGLIAHMHVATWTNPDEVAETCPHHPGVCYTGNGWYPLETKQVEMDVPGLGVVPVEVSLMDRGGQRVVIAFTYSMGEHRFATDGDARLVQAKMWGQSEWPAVTKFLMQVSSADIDEAMPSIELLLGEFLSWHHNANSELKVSDAEA